MSTCLLVLKAADILQREKGHQAYTTDDALHTHRSGELKLGEKKLITRGFNEI